MTESRSFEDVYKVQTERIAQLEHELAALRERLAQPERQWQGLTDEEIKDIVGRNDPDGIGRYTRELFRKIEAKLKEKNA